MFLNVPTMQQPEAYTGHANEHGKLVSDSTRIFQHDFMHAFADWVETVGSQGHHI